MMTVSMQVSLAIKLEEVIDFLLARSLLLQLVDVDLLEPLVLLHLIRGLVHVSGHF